MSTRLSIASRKISFADLKNEIDIFHHSVTAGEVFEGREMLDGGLTLTMFDSKCSPRTGNVS